METKHRNKLGKRCQRVITDQRLIVLGIPDDYEYMDPALVELLKDRMERWIPTEGASP